MGCEACSWGSFTQSFILLAVVTITATTATTSTTDMSTTATITDSAATLQTSLESGGVGGWMTMTSTSPLTLDMSSALGAALDPSIISSGVTLTSDFPDNNVTSLLPSSVSLVQLSSSVTTAPTTTTLDPIESLKCHGMQAPQGGNATYRLLVPDLLQYSCNQGYKEAKGQTLVECKPRGWENGNPDRILQCVAVDEDPVYERVPEELVTSLIVAGALLVLLAAGLALFTLLMRSSVGMTLGRTLTWQQATKPSPAVKVGQGRRWPWKRPPRPRHSAGHLGLDGVAWTVTPDTLAYGVK